MDPQRYQRIKSILMDALEAPALERGALVATACEGDPALHAEVMSLLAQHAEDTFLEPHEVGDQGIRVGSVIGGYRILSALGEGGMGVVYLGEDVRLGRRAALKFLKPELVFHPQAKARFIREAKAGATLDHPNICPLYGVDETSDGQLFLAMRFYEGETLKERVARGRLSIDTSLDIAAQMASGLGAAHRAGIVHRDVKPGNVLLVDNMVKILDFGIAKIADESPLTVYGAAIGTATYMSPEQAAGAAVDSRTDIWALGIVLYEMLTGGNVVAESALASLPPDLADVVRRATRRRADERYPSMSELADALESYRRKTRDLPTLVLGEPRHPQTGRGAMPPAPAMQSAALRFVEGPAELVGRLLPLANKSNTIGRARSCDVRVDFPSISRHHATLTPSERNRWRLEDAGSRNGVKVNGRLMPEPASEIEVGDRVGFGADIVAVLELDSPPAGSVSASPIPLEVSVAVSVFHPEVLVVRLSGVVDAQNCGVLRDHVVRAIESGRRLVIIDFSRCAGCDGAGFDVVVGLDVMLRRRAGALYLIGMGNDVKGTYRSGRLDRILFSRDDEASAAAALARIVRTLKT